MFGTTFISLRPLIRKHLCFLVQHKATSQAKQAVKWVFLFHKRSIGQAVLFVKVSCTCSISSCTKSINNLGTPLSSSWPPYHAANYQQLMHHHPCRQVTFYFLLISTVTWPPLHFTTTCRSLHPCRQPPLRSPKFWTNKKRLAVRQAVLRILERIMRFLQAVFWFSNHHLKCVFGTHLQRLSLPH